MDGIPNSTAPLSWEPGEVSGSPIPAWHRWDPLATTQPACCCAAKPVAVVVLGPVAPGGEPVELLLCGHHVRASWSALEAAGAAIFDAAGQLLMPTRWQFVTPVSAQSGCTY